jgi:hypothetical protein
MSDLLDRQCIDTLRFLALDMVQEADSGHPGLPPGAAPALHGGCEGHGDPGRWRQGAECACTETAGAFRRFAALHKVR